MPPENPQTPTGDLVTYRMDRLSFAVARRLVRTPHIALPNVLLDRRAYPELLQDAVTPERIAEAAERLLDRSSESEAAARELFQKLAIPGTASFGDRVAATLEDWMI